MTGLFIAPATDREGAYGHFRKTMLDGVPQEMYSKYVEEKLGDRAHVWGLTSSTKKTWKNIDVNDWVLFYTRENQYEYSAQVKRKQHEPDFGDDDRARHGVGRGVRTVHRSVPRRIQQPDAARRLG